MFQQYQSILNKCLITLAFTLLTSNAALAIPIFINEVHYDNIGGDINEGVEIAGPSGTLLDGWRIDLYNGSNNSIYNSMPLDGVINDLQGGYGVLSFMIAGMQNGGSQADAIALVDQHNSLIQFISYEGVLDTEIGISEDILVFETNSTPIGYSLQRIGVGQEDSDFTWQLVEQSSFGQINRDQQFIAPVIEPLIDNASATLPSPVPEPSSIALLCLGLIGLSWARGGINRTACLASK